MRALSAGVGLFLAACGSESSSPQRDVEDSGPSALPEERVAACGGWAKAYCPAYAGCRKTVAATQYVDEADCIAIETQRCLRERFLPGTGWTPAAIDACVAALDWSSCPAVLAHDTERSPIPECAPPGSLPNGSACMRAMQCQGGACVKTVSNLCGECGDAVAPGGACSDASECGPPLASCIQGKCWLRGDEGAPCASIATCKFHLICEAGSCSAPRGLGQPCSAQLACQEYPVPLRCNQKTGLCDEVVFSSEGGQCPTLDDGRTSRCVAPFGCKWVDAAAKLGECRAQVGIGEACGANWGYSNQCEYPLVCLTTCVELNAEYCTPQVLPP